MIEKLGSIARLTILFSLMFVGTPAHGQVQNPADPGGGPISTGPLDTRITKVTNRAVVGDDATLVIRLEWTTSSPPLARVLGFTAFVEVEYQDGTTNSNSNTVAADVRQADLRVLNKGANTPKRFKARVETRFRSLALTPFPFTASFDLNEANNFTSPPRRTSRDLVDIRGIVLKNQGCVAGKDCFTVSWTVHPQSDVGNISQFKIEGDFSYKIQGATVPVKTASATVGSSDRQAQLVVVGNTGTLVSSINAKVTVTALAETIKRVSTEKAGNF